MRLSIFTAIFLLVSNLSSGQTRTIKGLVLAEDLLPLPGVIIRTMNNTTIGKTDRDGKFIVDAPLNTTTLLFYQIGFERAIIKLNSNCDTVEIVMMESGSYDFMSSKKVDQLRLERFNNLSKLYSQAYKKGVFTKQSPCYSRDFEPKKSELDSIGREMVKRQKETRLTFKRLNVGDTVRIPFSDRGGFRADGTDRTTLIAYTSGSRWPGGYSGCLVKCIILSKNRRDNNRHKKGYHQRGYNIVCQVVEYSSCKDPSVFEGKVIEPGLVFSYNMRNSAILNSTQ